MKKFFTLFILMMAFHAAKAKHICGGEIIYECISNNIASNTKTYRITLILFRDESCFNCATMPPDITIGIFNNDNNEPYGGPGTNPTLNQNLSKTEVLPITNVPLCITNQPNLKYTAGYYYYVVTLKNNNKGYTAAYQTCCRIENINNIDNGQNGAGATYTCTIPGLNTLDVNSIDNSPKFSKGISIVCYNNNFILDFSATDQDGDQLEYSICNAYNGGLAVDASNITPSVPPYGSLDYINGFTGTTPLGLKASINPQTGIISGIAPAAGKYVVSVCVNSFRNGNFIETHRKDFIITVAACEFASAELLPEYITCDGYSFDFSNRSQSPLNQSFYWDFGDPSSVDNISTVENPSHTFSAAGDYTIKFVVNRGSSCADSTTSLLKVYPGFFPDFINNAPRCKDVPVNFTDKSKHLFGNVNSWRWDFGLTGSQADTSRLKDPLFVYSQPGTYNITLIVGSDKGCVDTISKSVTIVDKPTLTLSTKDTLICKTDNIQINASASGPGNITWQPNYNINNINTFTPIVSPKKQTTYTLTFNDNFGCQLIDSIRIDVVDSVLVRAGNDTIICKKDAVTLTVESNGVSYSWSPSGTLNDALIKNPVATPVDPVTKYFVTASIGNCSAIDSISITTAPYPKVTASNDTIICLGTSVNLQASGGSSYTWSPSKFLSNPNSSNPAVVNPSQGVYDYVVSVTNNASGCPKPTLDTVRVTVDNIIADAGPRDTSVVTGQPLQLNAKGGTVYQWSPELWLSNPVIANPVSKPQNDILYVVRVSNTVGCYDTDSILVKFYTVKPEFYMPNAFTPNGDGLNDVIKPVALGLKSIEQFNIYNRWGQLVFSTSQIGAGWDGNYKGLPQEGGTYVWYAEGTDYTDIKLFKKGTLILIR